MRAVYRIIRLVKIGASPESAAAQEMHEAASDVVSVGGEFPSHAEGLSHGGGKHHVSHVGETAYLIQPAPAPVGAGVVCLYHEDVSPAETDAHTQFISHTEALVLELGRFPLAVVAAQLTVVDAVAADGGGNLVGGTHGDNVLAGKRLVVLDAEFSTEIIHLQGVSGYHGTVGIVPVDYAGFLADVAEGVIELGAHGQAVPEGGGGGGKELIGSAVAH